eukprot:2023294-Rhodomonas_salina.1
MVKALTLAHVVPRAINGAVCGNVIARIAGLTESNSTATCWIACSITLKSANKEEMYVWSTLFNELCAEFETDTLDKEPSKAPLPLANGPAGAVSYYSLAQMEK